MASYVKMPQKGLSEDSAILSKWYVKEGDEVKKGELLFAIETGKATFDIESEFEGTVLKTVGAEGDEIAVKATVAVIGTPGEEFKIEEAPKTAASPAAQATAAVPAAAKAAAPAARSAAAPAVSEAEAGGPLKISPRALALAKRKDIDVRFAIPSGPGGRIIERDIEAMLFTGPFVSEAAQGLATGEEIGTGLGGEITTADLSAFDDVKHSNIRRIIAKNMHDSLANMAQLTHNSYADATRILALRAEYKASGDPNFEKISLNDMVMLAVSRTLLQFPELNAHYFDDEMRLFRTVNLGMAVDTPRGLLVPTLMHAEKLGLPEMSAALKSLASECQSGSIDPSKLKNATFTVSNLGAFGITSFTPIINPPQTGILGVCNIEYRVRMKGGQPEFFPTINLSLTYDHRAVDGAPASRFLQALAKNIENIDELL